MKGPERNAKRAIEHARDSLLRIIEKTDEADVERKLFPNSKSIGEILLHIAGFEFVVTEALPEKIGMPSDMALWSRIKTGFAREAGFSEPSGLQLADYAAALLEVRARTLALLDAGQDRKVEASHYDVRGCLGKLASLDAQASGKIYDNLYAAVGTSFEDDIAEDECGFLDWVSLLIVHETYHRGQLTYMRYVLKEQARSI